MKKLLRDKGLVEREVSKLFHHFSFRKVFITIGIRFSVWSIFTLVVINRTILSCGLLSTRK